MSVRLVLTVLLPWLAAAAAAEPGDALQISEPRARGWTLHVDNDAFTFGDNDRDYTAGAAFSLEGDRAATHPLSLARALRWTDAKTRFSVLARDAIAERSSLEIGLLLFTPQDLSALEPLLDDRPYASLAYVTSGKLAQDPSRRIAYQSSLTLGVLGLPVAESVHRTIHRAIGSRDPRGYDHQIAEGGEPTFRYAVTRQQLLAHGVLDDRPYQLRWGLGASVGYLTEANAELAFRFGGKYVRWWSSPPATSDYADHPVATPERTAGGGRPEIVFDGGVKVRARAYNSLLQGQFRDSDVEHSTSDLNHVLLEGWIGVTALFPRLSVSYTVRRQTEELENGSGSRSFTWAGIGVSQRF
jgi:hypothetical protein